MGLTVLDNALWVAGFVGHVALLAVLLVRSRWRNFPVFTSLIAYQAAVTVTFILCFSIRQPARLLSLVLDLSVGRLHFSGRAHL